MHDHIREFKSDNGCFVSLSSYDWLEADILFARALSGGVLVVPDCTTVAPR